jgi:hypothetical protein
MDKSNITGLDIISLTSQYLRKSTHQQRMIGHGEMSWEDSEVTETQNKLQELLSIEASMMKGKTSLLDIPEWVCQEILASTPNASKTNT